MIRVVYTMVHYIHAVMLSAGAILALVVLPPAGLLMLVILQRHLKRGPEHLHARA